MSVSVPTQFDSYVSSAAVNSAGAQAITADVPVNALMLVKLSGAGIPTAYTMADSKGHTWSSLTLASQPTGTIMSEQWFYAKCTTALTVAGGDTLTPGRTGTSNSLTMIAKYVTGQDLTTPIGNSGVQATGSSSTSVTTLSCSGSVAALAGDLVVGGVTVNGNSTTITSSIFTGISSVVSVTTNTRRSGMGYKQVTGSESDTGQFGWTTTNPGVTTAFVVTAAASATMDAGSDQASIEPGDTVTLNSSGSSGVTGGRTWSQRSGSPTVTLSSTSATSPTFTAPPELTDTNLVFRVTDNVTSSWDEVTIGILRSSRRVKIGSTITPVYRRVTL